MIYKHYERKEHIVYFLIVLIGFYFVMTRSYSATTISSDVQSDGNFTLNSANSSLVFFNGWKFLQNNATTTQVTVTDATNNPVLIFDAN